MKRVRGRVGGESSADVRRREVLASAAQQKEELERPREFTRELMVYHRGLKEAEYRRRKNEAKNTVKWGQRKLLLTTIQFFTVYWDPVKIPKPVCVYVGAAPGYSINIMSLLFPDIQWHLYDSANFNRKLPTQNVTVYKQYFEDKDIATWKGKDIFFMSDIRDPDIGFCVEGGEKIVKGVKYPFNKYDCEKITLGDMLFQEKWVYELNPIYASLKFRLPWEKGFYVDENGKEETVLCPYLQGDVYLQPWLSPTSTETRLVPTRNSDGNYYSVNWECGEYERRLFYHNTIQRNTFKYQNPFPSEDNHIDGLELTDDWDSLCETQILRDYLNKIGQPDTIENVRKLSRTITNILNESGPVRSEYKTLRSLRIPGASHGSVRGFASSLPEGESVSGGGVRFQTPGE